MPNYTYRCFKCQRSWEQVHVISDRKSEKCPACGVEAQIIITASSYPVVYEYYDDGLGVQVTGTKQRRQIMKNLNLEDK